MAAKTGTKRTHRSGVHPTDTPLTTHDQPVSQATGAKLLAKLALTEGEALAILDAAATPATQDELEAVLKIDVDAVAHALDEHTVHALVTDPAIELPAIAADFEAVASRIRVAAAGVEKLQQCIDDVHGATRVDADTAQRVLSDLVPKLRARIRSNPNVRKTYSTVLAYQSHRFPGRHAGHPAPVPPVQPAKSPPAASTGGQEPTGAGA